MFAGRKIVGIDVGNRTEDMLRGLRWIAPSAFVARFLTGVATVLAARWMGPAHFGEASLALAVTFWIQVPLFLGIPIALMHFLPALGYEERLQWEQVGRRLLAVTVLITLTVSYLFRPLWARLNGVSVETFELGLIWCTGYAVYFSGTALLNARESYKSRAIAEIIFASAFAGSIYTLRLAHQENAVHYIMALALGYGLTGAVILIRPAAKFTGPAPDHMKIAKAILTYSLIATVGTLSAALFNAPGRLIANHYLSLKEVGILSAYQGGSINMASFFIGIASQVFFPIASRTPNKKTLLKKMTRILLLSVPPAWVAFVFLLILYFTVLGKHYTFYLPTLLLFACAACAALWNGLLGWFLAAVGHRGMLASTLIGVITGAFNMIGCFIFIPRWHLAGAALAYVVATGAAIISCYLPWVQRKLKLS